MFDVKSNAFVISVTVSAKANDRSVHVAIQSLIRHLLQQGLKQKRLQAKGGLFNKENEQEDKDFVTISPLGKKEDKFVPLIKVKIPEVSGISSSMSQFPKIV